MAGDIAKTLREYKELLDDDIITREEYEEKKKELLGEEDYNAQNNNSAKISNRASGIVAYIGWIGFLIVLLAGDYKSNPFHVNQAFVLHLFSMLSIVPFVGWIWGVVVFVLWIMGLSYAIDEREKKIPILGNIKIID